MQESQNAFDVNFEAWQLESTMCWKPPVRKASVTIRFRRGVYQHDYCCGDLHQQCAVVARKMIVQPLAIIGSHFDSIARVIWRVRLRYMVVMRSPPFFQPEDHAAGFAWDGE